jgi:hypothetical protein
MASRVLLIGSMGCLALAVSYATVQWILYTDALVRPFLSF